METSVNTIKSVDRRLLFTIVVTNICCWIFASISIKLIKDYGAGLIIWLPFVLGAGSTILYGINEKNRDKRSFAVSFMTLVVFCAGILVFALDGLICLVMALPIGLFLAWLGHLVGDFIIRRRFRNSTTAAVLFFVSVPAFMAFENAKTSSDDPRSVTTSIEINAGPEAVWKNVVAFPQLDPPKELIFRTGIAYPINATINGTGVGAIRHCNFSTGSFVEPITVWDEPRLLRFSVDEQPEPMKELSPYEIHPDHLHGYWVSKQGQFKLTALPNGHTLLEGTTWYVNKISPGFYWTLWSDLIVHKIHQRVFAQIKKETE